MISIDLTRLRPGDVIFSLYPAASSRAIAAMTGSSFSHAMLVLYPDVWFETDGAGSGFKQIENIKAYGDYPRPYEIIAELPYVKFDVLRLPNPPSLPQLLGSINEHIAFRYPSWAEFLPLMVGFNYFPRQAEALVRAITKNRSYTTGSYCSQLVFKVLDDPIGLPASRKDGHISPGSLRRALYRIPSVKKVDCSVQTASIRQHNAQLERQYLNLLKVTGKLRSYQYPHDRKSQEAALAQTFADMGLPLNPNSFSIMDSQLRPIISRPRYFRLHDIFWPPRYR